MNDVQYLIEDVSRARERLVAAVTGLSAEQAEFSPYPDGWCITGIMEHLVLAEQDVIIGTWRALTDARRNRPTFGAPPRHRRLIEEVIDSTWRERGNASQHAAPISSWPLEFWVASLCVCQSMLEALGARLTDAARTGVALEDVICPHPITGSLNARQRFEYLRLHMDRHRAQIERLKAHLDFPGTYRRKAQSVGGAAADGYRRHIARTSRC
jgi:hypothetical protein